MLPPVIVNISRLHRETAAVIEQADRSESPIFVTQHAYVAAVLLPRRMYDRLLRAADKGTRAKGTAATAAACSHAECPGDRGESGRDQPGAGCEAAAGQSSWTTTVASPLEGPLAVFGPLPPHTKFLSKYGVQIDAQLAAFLMEEGEEVRPILEHRRDDGEDEW
jgi:prevent-host-death family protein